MPTKKVLAEKENKAIDEKWIYSRIDQIRDYFREKLQEVKEMKNPKFQAICLFSLLDCYAQEYYNYPPHGSKKAFIDFVLKYQNKYNYLEEIEPVTFFYDIEDYVEKKINPKCEELLLKNPDIQKECPELFEPRLEIDIEDLHISDERLVKEFVGKNKESAFVDYISNKIDEKKVNSLKKAHQVINLIYKMRSKLVHEMSSLGSESKYENLDEPYYRDMSRMYGIENQFVSDKVYELVFPAKFLFDLTENTIENYLDDCVLTKRDPFKNNKLGMRKVMISWNDDIV